MIKVSFEEMAVLAILDGKEKIKNGSVFKYILSVRETLAEIDETLIVNCKNRNYKYIDEIKLDKKMAYKLKDGIEIYDISEKIKNKLALVKESSPKKITEVKQEIERKFYVYELPENLDNYKSEIIEQTYISKNPEIRLRKKGDKYFYTKKGEGTLSRSELEFEITYFEYTVLLNKKIGNTIKKIRYYIPIDNGMTAELDVYGGHLEGLKTVEVEFLNLRKARRFNKPDWFGFDVTGWKIFKNKELATNTKAMDILYPKEKQKTLKNNITRKN